jgi:integrase
MGKSRQRANGEGSIYYREDVKRYVVSFFSADGKRKYRKVKTKREAQEILRQSLQQRDEGMLPPGPQQTVKQFLEDWLENVCKPPALRISTYVKYRKLIYSYILPIIRRYQLQKLTPQHVQRLYRQKSDDGLQPKTIQSIHGVLHRALDTAVAWSLVPRNVCDRVKPPKVSKPEIQPLTMQQAQILLRAAGGQRLDALLVIVVTTGMRHGELLGLRWSDVDFEHQCLHIRRTLDYIAHYGNVITEPKTARGQRKIDLPDFVIERLQQHRVRQLELKLKTGVKWKEEGYVFTGLKGGVLNSRYLNKLFGKLLREAELPAIRFHDLRHSAATILLSMGVHPKIVQELLGHENISTTLGIYSHVLPSLQKETMDKWDIAFGHQSEKEKGAN